MKVLATGATGGYAGLVVPALIARGIDVRAMVHDPAKADVARAQGASEMVEADLADPASLLRALDGVDGVFLITPAFHPHAAQLGLNMVQAAETAGVRKIVYNGVYHPSLGLLNHATTRPVEEALYASDLDFTVLQPAMYVQALAATYAQALVTGSVVMPWSKTSKMTYVDYRDVADAAAVAFTDDRLARGTFELAAGGMLNRIEIAELLSVIAGRTLIAEDLPVGVGSFPGAPDGLAAMFDDYDVHGFHGGNSLVLRTHRAATRTAQCRGVRLRAGSVTLVLDPQIAAALAPVMAGASDAPALVAGDLDGRRAALDPMLIAINQLEPAAADVSVVDYHLTTGDGATLLVRWYTKNGVQPGSAVLYLHGGGMILGSVAAWDGPVSRIVSRSGVPFLSVEYRLAPEWPYPTPLNDSYAGLIWLHEHAEELRVDPARIAVMGNSAGGGLPAAVSILARDRHGPAIARQLLIFAMLDDRTTVPDPNIVPYAAWSYDDNITAWQAILGDDAGTDAVPADAAPGRLTDARGLPPAYFEAGQLDIFRDEDLRYAVTLSQGAVPVELTLTPGAPHEFDVIAYDSDAAHRAIASRIRVLQSL